MDNDLINACWIAWLCGVLTTMSYLTRHTHTEGLSRPARFSIQFTIWLAGMMFPLTWLLIGLRRLKQVWRP